MFLSSFTLFFTTLLDPKTTSPNNDGHLDTKNPDLDRLKTSYAANLTGFPIYIDDSDPNYNWSKTAEDNVWLDETADGSSLNPYYIENILINNLNSNNNSVEIRNSNVVFIIRNCYFYNTNQWGDDDESNGIYLYNVNNGIINNNTFSECRTGIRIENSQYNSISSNFVSYNNYQGVMIDSSSYNSIYNNTVSHSRDGISLYNSNYNELVENTISKNTQYSDDSGIYFYQSGGNNITKNIISSHKYRAIRMSYSDLNNFSGNSIFNNGLGMFIDDGSDSNIITGNFIYNHTGSEEWSDPFEGDGIYCDSGQNNVIDNNDIYDNSGSGINLQNIGGFNLTNNNLWSNDLDDINLKGTTNFELTSNIMTGKGLFLDISYSSLPGVDIDSTNKVNGKPIYFYYNQDYLDSSNFTNAGQIYLYSCDYTVLSNFDFPNVTTGITLSRCDNNTISFIEASYNSRWGVRLYECFNTDLSRINVFNSESGIELENCVSNDFNDNTASYNIGNGFTLTNCSTNDITGNFASYNRGNGLDASGVNNSYVYNNTANYNGYEGIGLYTFGNDEGYWNSTLEEWVTTYWSCIQSLTFLSNIAIGNNGTGFVISAVNNSIITENIANNNAIGITIDHTLDCLIYENKVEKNALLGIGLNEGHDTDFYNNTAKENYSFEDWGGNPHGIGFTISHCESVEVYNNYAFKNYIGMFISECTDCDIKENTLNKNGDINPEGIIHVGGYEEIGLRVDKCEFIDVFQNSLNTNYIKMTNSHNNSLILNDITWGGLILEACNQNIILGNSIYRGDVGVALKDSSYNQILNNTITSQQCFRETGICIGNIFENNFCKEEVPFFFIREIMTIIGIAGVLGLNIPLYLKKRKNR